MVHKKVDTGPEVSRPNVQKAHYQVEVRGIEPRASTVRLSAQSYHAASRFLTMRQDSSRFAPCHRPNVDKKWTAARRRA